MARKRCSMETFSKLSVFITERTRPNVRHDSQAPSRPRPGRVQTSARHRQYVGTGSKVAGICNRWRRPWNYGGNDLRGWFMAVVCAGDEPSAGAGQFDANQVLIAACLAGRFAKFQQSCSAQPGAAAGSSNSLSRVGTAGICPGWRRLRGSGSQADSHSRD